MLLYRADGEGSGCAADSHSASMYAAGMLTPWFRLQRGALG